MEIPGWALLALFTALAGTAAFLDVRSRTIPNWLNLAIAVLGLVSVLLVGGTNAALLSLGHLAVALALGMVAYAFKMWGGGDAKFYAATAAWFSLTEFPGLIITISLAGLALLIGWFSMARLRRREEGVSARNAQLPYGLAIAAGGILTMAARTF